MLAHKHSEMKVCTYRAQSKTAEQQFVRWEVLCLLPKTDNFNLLPCAVGNSTQERVHSGGNRARGSLVLSVAAVRCHLAKLLTRLLCHTFACFFSYCSCGVVMACLYADVSLHGCLFVLMSRQAVRIIENCVLCEHKLLHNSCFSEGSKRQARVLAPHYSHS